MNGLGNDFLIYDARKHPRFFTRDEILKLSSRDNKQTKGCDQLIIIGPAETGGDISMLVYNSDGSEVYACGNASRCVAAILDKEGKKGEVFIETKADILSGKAVSADMVSVDMKKPRFDWKEIPLSHEVDIKNLPIEIEGFAKPFAVSMGNPHMVFTTEKDVESIDVIGLGETLEHHKLYPERANVGFAQIVDRDNINLRVFERGAGETLACGTGACAAAVTAISRGLVNRKVNIKTHGGPMVIEWRESDSHVIMTGPVAWENPVSADI